MQQFVTKTTVIFARNKIASSFLCDVRNRKIDAWSMVVPHCEPCASHVHSPRAHITYPLSRLMRSNAMINFLFIKIYLVQGELLIFMPIFRFFFLFSLSFCRSQRNRWFSSARAMRLIRIDHQYHGITQLTGLWRCAIFTKLPTALLSIAQTPRRFCLFATCCIFEIYMRETNKRIGPCTNENA